MRQQVHTLLSSLPKLANVMMLIGFVMLVYGILGVELFRDALLDRCYLPLAAEPIDAQMGICVASAACGVSCNANASAAERQGSCALGLECRRYGRDPKHGTVSFDNILRSLLTVGCHRARTLTTHHSPLTTHGLRLATYYSRLATRHSSQLLTTHTLTTHDAPRTTAHFPLGTLHLLRRCSSR